MNPKEAIESIVAIERKFRVNTVQYRGLRLWPLIRLSLWAGLHQPAAGTVGKWVRSSNAWEWAILWGKRIVRAVQLVSPAAFWRFFQGRRAISQHQGVDFVFFSRLEDYTDRIDGRFVNRHVDPIVDLVKKRWSFVKIELESPGVFKRVPRLEPTLFLNPTYSLLKGQLLSLIQGRDVIEYFDDLQEVVKENTGGLRLDSDDLVAQANRLAGYEALFTRWLSRLRPKAVFLVCYYDVIGMALVKACKGLQIETVDIQHGKQGKYHGLYTHWTKIPEGGYELLPDFFWSWGPESKNNIERWYPKGLHYHRPIVGGNRWLAMWMGTKLDENSPASRAFYKNMKRFAQTVLVSLQPMANPLPAHLLDAMRDSPENWIWLVRLHPLAKESTKQIEQSLKAHRVTNFEIEHTTEIPLYALLKRVSHHITCWSSVCYETLPFHVPTTIVHPTGRELYDDYIRRGIFRYADSSEQVLASVARPVDKSQLTEPTRYIETELDYAENALNIILNNKAPREQNAHPVPLAL